MMRIRCPNCSSTHEVPASALEGKSRKVRCASCRTVFEAVPETDSPALSTPLAPPPAIILPEHEDALIGENNAEMLEAPGITTRIEPEPASAIADPDMNSAMGQDDLDALFADAPATVPDPAPAPSGALNAPLGQAPSPLEAGQDAAMIAAAAAAAKAMEAAGAEPGEAPRPRRPNPYARPPRKAGFRLAPALGLIAATGIGTLVGLTVFRHEAVRMAPGLASYFELMGLEVNSTGLDIRAVRSRIVMEDQREMLEIAGEIVNISGQRRPVPVIRLSLHNAEGRQLYVWTGTADTAELGGGDKTTFRRRLASPPKDAVQVMVRFVARDDIVAAIR
jgi:predicted Zn finger-like uncharacterized protein